MNGGGLISIDVEGSHPRSKFIQQLHWLREIGFNRRTEVIDLNDLKRLTPLNNLAPMEGVHPTVLADETAVAFQRISGENWTEKPLLESTMHDLLSAAAVLELTIPDIRYLLDPDDEHGLRRWAIENMPDEFLRDGLLRFDQAARAEKSKRDFRQMTMGALNRFSDIVRYPMPRLATGAGPRLPIADIIDEGGTILLDASPGSQVGETAAKTYCALLVRAVFSSMRQRRHPERLALLSIDEAAAAIGGGQADVESLAARARKYGVCCLFGMQYGKQLSETQNLALKNCVSTRITFRVADGEEAEQRARDDIPMDLERPKQSMVRPTNVGVKRTTLSSKSRSTNEARGRSKGETESESQAASATEAHGESEAFGFSSFEAEGAAQSDSAGQIFDVGPNGMPVGLPLSRSANQGSSLSSVSGAGTSAMRGKMSMQAKSVAASRGHASSTASHETSGKSEGVSEGEAFEPIYDNLPSQLYSLEESVYQAARTLKHLQPGEAIIAFGDFAGKVKVPLLPTVDLSKEENVALRRRFIDASPSSIPIEEAKAALNARKARLIALASKHQAPPPDPKISERELMPVPIADDPLQFAANLLKKRESSKDVDPPETTPPKPPKPKKPVKKAPFRPKIVGGNPALSPPRKPRDPKPL
jgi:hypothetical protein